MKNMDFLEQLLDGQKVEWKKLGEVAEYIRGVTYNKNAETQNEDSWVVLRANNIDIDSRQLCFDDLKRVVRTTRVRPNQYLQVGDILICAGSGSKQHIGKTAYIDEELGYTFGGFMGVIRCDDSVVLPRFLFHYLGSVTFREYLEFSLYVSTINNLNSTIMNAFPIPLPSLSVQSRIVEILDKFTALEAELEQQLQAELELRKKQYQHYREQLLNFSSTPPHEFNVIWRKLGEVAEIGTGRSNREDEATDGAYPFYVRSKNILRSSTYQFDETAIVIPGEGGIGDIYHYVVGKYALHQRAYRIKLKSEEKIVPKFVYYYMTSAFKRYIISKSVGATATSIRKPMIEGFPIPIPALSEQARIVEILDKFDALTNSITEGLPLEIKLRKQQYEYYREQLLDFRRF